MSCKDSCKPNFEIFGRKHVFAYLMWCTDTSDPRHFGPTEVRTQDTSAWPKCPDTSALAQVACIQLHLALAANFNHWYLRWAVAVHPAQQLNRLSRDHQTRLTSNDSCLMLDYVRVIKFRIVIVLFLFSYHYVVVVRFCSRPSALKTYTPSIWFTYD